MRHKISLIKSLFVFEAVGIAFFFAADFIFCLISLNKIFISAGFGFGGKK